MQGDTGRQARLLDVFGAGLLGGFVRLQGQRNLVLRGDGREQDAQRRGIFDGLGGALGDVGPDFRSVARRVSYRGWEIAG